MAKKIVVINGSPRKNGNIAGKECALIACCEEGAVDKGDGCAQASALAEKF